MVVVVVVVVAHSGPDWSVGRPIFWSIGRLRCQLVGRLSDCSVDWSVGRSHDWSLGGFAPNKPDRPTNHATKTTRKCNLPMVFNNFFGSTSGCLANLHGAWVLSTSVSKLAILPSGFWQFGKA